LKRWIGVSAAALAAMCAMATLGTAQASSRHWYQVYQANVPGGFFDIAAISKTDVWAVGTLFKGSKTVYRPFIRHYDGSGWRIVTIPRATGFTSDWVAASSPDNVWVGGRNYSSTAITRIYRYDGSHWHRVPLPARYTYLSNPVVLGPNNVWVFGDSTPADGNVFHWTGSGWHAYYINAFKFMPQSMVASAASNVWLAGLMWVGRKEEAFAYRWNGRAWHSVRSPHPVADVGPSVTAISPSNVWLGWVSRTYEHALHWDGHRWDPLTVPSNAGADPLNIVPDGKGGYWFGDSAILTGNTWTGVPAIDVITGGFEQLVRIPGTHSFLEPAGVENFGSSVIKPTIYRFDL